MKSINLLGKIKYLSIIILLILTAFSYHPMFSNVVTEMDSTNPLSKYMILMAAVCFVLNFNFELYSKSKFITKILWIFIPILFIGLFFNLSGIDKNYFSDSKNIGMAVMFILIGYGSRLDSKRLEVLVIIYSLAVAYCTYMQIIQNFGGFVINDLYMQYGKNTLGVMTASSCIACVVLASFSSGKYLKFLEWGIAALLLFLTITIRARAAFLTIFAIVAYLVYRKAKQNGKSFHLLATAIIVVSVICIFHNFFNGIFDYIFDSLTRNRGGDITSGRLSRNAFALDLIGRSPFFGNMVLHEKYEWIHNYFLRVLSSYGIIGAIPLVYMYLFLIIKAIKYLRLNGFNIYSIGLIVVLVPYVISLEEPTFPYAPGTGTVLPFILLGYSLYQAFNQSYNPCRYQ